MHYFKDFIFLLIILLTYLLPTYNNNAPKIEIDTKTRTMVVVTWTRKKGTYAFTMTTIKFYFFVDARNQSTRRTQVYVWESVRSVTDSLYQNNSSKTAAPCRATAVASHRYTTIATTTASIVVIYCVGWSHCAPPTFVGLLGNFITLSLNCCLLHCKFHSAAGSFR